MLCPIGMGDRITWVFVAALALLVGCASGLGDSDAGGGGPEGGRPDGQVSRRDAGTLCGSVRCDPFQYCDAGRCVDYPPCAGSGSCPRPGDVCANRHCVPGDVDIDGDGSPAAEDCDETDPAVHPGADEICNGIDDDCDGTIDEGDPAAICEFYPGGGICEDGSCGCPPGTFDLDREVPGCECVAMPAIDQGLDCGSAIDLGLLMDNGQTLTVRGNVMPDDRDVWYRFRGVDSFDSSCDNYHVRAQLLTNPDDTFEIAVFRDDCAAAAECDGAGFTDYSWATDFRATIDGRLTGQCPCYARGATPVANVSVCEDDSADYFVRVRRRTGSTLGCQEYALELSNGLYDTP